MKYSNSLCAFIVATLLLASQAFAIESKAIAVTADHQSLAVSYNDEHVVRVFSLADGSLQKTLPTDQPNASESELEFSALAFNADGTRLVGGAWAQGTYLWDVEAEKLIKHATTANIVDTVFFNDNGIVVLADESTALYDSDLNKVHSARDLQRQAISDPDFAFNTPFRPQPKKLGYAHSFIGEQRGDYWVSANRSDRRLTIWQVKDEKRLGTIRSKWGDAFFLAPNDELWLYKSRAMAVYDLKTRALKRVIGLDGFDVDEIRYLDFSADGALVAISVELENDNTQVIVLNIADSTLKTVITPDSHVYATKFLDNSRLLLDTQFPIEVWDINKNEKVLNIAKTGSDLSLSSLDVKKLNAKAFHVAGGFNALDVNDNGEIAVSGEENLLFARTGQLAQVFSAPYAEAHDIRFSPDGAQVAFAFQGERVLVFDVKTGKLQKSYELGNVPDATEALRFSPDGKWLLAGSSSGALHLIDLSAQQAEKTQSFSANIHDILWLDNDSALIATEHEVARVSRQTHSKTTVYEVGATALAGYADHADNRKVTQIAIGHEDEDLQLFDGDLTPLKTFAQKDIKRLAFSGDGKQLIATSSDALAVWDIATGKACRKDGFSDGYLYGMAVDKAEKRVITGDAEPILRFDFACQAVE